jgi:hypothetical protein
MSVRSALCRFGLVVLVLCFMVPASGEAQEQAGRPYPLVIGPTGSPYGPTQAHYQYLRRYGRPWDGQGQRLYGGPEVGHVNGYPISGFHYHAGTLDYAGPLFPMAPQPNFGFFFPPFPFLGMGIYNTPAFLPGEMPGAVPGQVLPPGQPAFPNPLGEMPQGANRFEKIPLPESIVEPSPPEAQRHSVRYQAQGDEQLRQLNYLAAAQRYRKAISAARDRAEPRYRLGVAMAARGEFIEAVKQFKLAVELDSAWVEDPERLEELLGEQNVLEKAAVKARVAEWTHEDVRDADRLFLLGVILYLDGDDRSRTLLETAMLLEGETEHLVAFLNPLAPGAEHPLPEAGPGRQQPPGDHPPIPAPPPPGIDPPHLPPLPD